MTYSIVVRDRGSNDPDAVRVLAVDIPSAAEAERMSGRIASTYPEFGRSRHGSMHWFRDRHGVHEMWTGIQDGPVPEVPSQGAASASRAILAAALCGTDRRPSVRSSRPARKGFAIPALLGLGGLVAIALQGPAAAQDQASDEGGAFVPAGPVLIADLPIEAALGPSEAAPKVPVSVATRASDARTACPSGRRVGSGDGFCLIN
jgi:hypothetical protein